MQRFYFTFGSWEKFPYKNTYLIVIAENFDAAVKAYREKYPDVYEGCLNCSSYYPESTWQKSIAELYKDMQPAEIIETKLATKYLRIVKLLEKLFSQSLETVIGLGEEYMNEWLENKIGTTREELESFGIDIEKAIEEAYKW